MILWVTGNTGSGKTTLAKRLVGKNTVLLDGDEMRATINRGLGLTKKDRWENNIRIARLAKLLEDQGFVVIVSVICPYEALRREVETITGCKWIYVPGGKEGEEFPYEVPGFPVIKVEK